MVELVVDRTIQRKQAAWRAAAAVAAYNPDYARKDPFGWWILWSEYGNRESAYGWIIDHTVPIVRGGLDELTNLRAIHCRNLCLLGGYVRRGAGVLVDS